MLHSGLMSKMGRKPKPDALRETIRVKVNTEQKDKLVSRAARAGKPLATYLRETALAK